MSKSTPCNADCCRKANQKTSSSSDGQSCSPPRITLHRNFFNSVIARGFSFGAMSFAGYWGFNIPWDFFAASARRRGTFHRFRARPSNPVPFRPWRDRCTPPARHRVACRLFGSSVSCRRHFQTRRQNGRTVAPPGACCDGHQHVSRLAPPPTDRPRRGSIVRW